MHGRASVVSIGLKGNYRGSSTTLIVLFCFASKVIIKYIIHLDDLSAIPWGFHYIIGAPSHTKSLSPN